jgi:hypothetical protein
MALLYGYTSTCNTTHSSIGSSTTSNCYSTNYNWYSYLKIEKVKKVKKPDIVITKEGVFQCSNKKFKFNPEELIL